MGGSANGEFNFTRQTGEEAVAAIGRMADVDVIVELEGGSIRFGTDRGEYCLITNEVVMADFDTDEMLLGGGGGISVLRFSTLEERDRYANAHQPGEILDIRGWLSERPGTRDQSARSTGSLVLDCLEDWMRDVRDESAAFGAMNEKDFQVALGQRLAKSRKVAVEKYLKDRGDGRPVLPGWAPGPLDLEVLSTDGSSWLELKWVKGYGDLYRCTWDVAKLATAVRYGIAKEGFIVAGAQVAEWEKDHPYKDFFRFGSHTGRSLFLDYEKDWREWYDERKSTYPTVIPSQISTIPVGYVVGPDGAGEEWAIRVSRVVTPTAGTYRADDFSS
jgi:hypothetical protein